MLILMDGLEEKSIEEARKNLELISKNLAAVLKSGETNERKRRRP